MVDNSITTGDTIHITNCRTENIGDLNSAIGTAYVEITGDTVFGYIKITRGAVSGCYVVGDNNFNCIIIYSGITGEAILIKGNQFLQYDRQDAIVSMTDQNPLIITNNYFY